MKRILLLAFVLTLGSVASVQAQTATPASKLVWDEIGQVSATAGSAAYKAYVDNQTTGTPLSGVSCAAAVSPLNPAADSTCQAPMPALTPGAHTITLTQSIGGAESVKSTALSFTYVVVVTPTSLRVQ
jgi:hypothetical protein